jgi:hypothetical protein
MDSNSHIAAVGKPCIAKIADLASRPFAYIVVRKSTYCIAVLPR